MPTTAASSSSVPESSYAVELHCGEPVSLSAASSADLYANAVQLVTTAEYNSNSPQWQFPLSEVQQEYLQALAGDYVRVSLAQPLPLTNFGGHVSVLQIIVRVSPHKMDWRSQYPDHFMDSLFAIDEQHKVIGYALYRGVTRFKLFSVIAAIPNNTCHVPPREVIQSVLDRDRSGH